MRKIFFILTATILFSLPNFVNATRSDNPTCVLMTFTDDTRYDAINSAGELSDRVMLKLIESKKFNLKEFEPLKEDLEARLYDEKVDELTKFDSAIESGNTTNFLKVTDSKKIKRKQSLLRKLGKLLRRKSLQKLGKITVQNILFKVRL